MSSTLDSAEATVKRSGSGLSVAYEMPLSQRSFSEPFGRSLNDRAAVVVFALQTAARGVDRLYAYLVYLCIRHLCPFGHRVLYHRRMAKNRNFTPLRFINCSGRLLPNHGLCVMAAAAELRWAFVGVPVDILLRRVQCACINNYCRLCTHACVYLYLIFI